MVSKGVSTPLKNVIPIIRDGPLPSQVVFSNIYPPNTNNRVPNPEQTKSINP